MNFSTAIWVAKSILGLARKIPASRQHPVLIVEDNPHDADLICMFCEKFGAEAVQARSLQDARVKLAKQRFRLMFVDENMKDGSGVGFIDEITPDHPNLPISIITGDPSISEKLWAGRNWSIIMKGSHGSALGGAVENAILTANGVNGHTQPPAVIVAAWVMCALSFLVGVLYRELPTLLQYLKGIIK